jgi:hypothetical protein
VALGGGIATARGKYWGPLLIVPPAAMLAIWLVGPLAPLFTAALLVVTALALVEAALLWMRRPKPQTGPAPDRQTGSESPEPA